MHIRKTINAFIVFAAVFLLLSAASPAWAKLPEISLDTFAPGIRSDIIAHLKLQIKKDGKEFHGPVAWDGYELAVSGFMEDGKVTSAMLRGMQDNGLIGMFIAEMSKRNMLPALLDNDGVKIDLMREFFDKGMNTDQCSEFAMQAMGQWASEGKKALSILFLPEMVFMRAGADTRDFSKVPLDEILRRTLGFDPNLVPYDEKIVYGLFLNREDDSLVFRIGSVENAGPLLKNWNAQQTEKP